MPSPGRTFAAMMSWLRVPAGTMILAVGAIGLGSVLIFTDVLPLSGVGTGASVAVGGLTVLVTTAYSARCGEPGLRDPTRTGVTQGMRAGGWPEQTRDLRTGRWTLPGRTDSPYRDDQR